MIFALKLVTNDEGETASVELIPIETIEDLEEACRFGANGQFAHVIQANSEEEARQAVSNRVRFGPPRSHERLM